jgi:hypothetical protein
LFERSGHRRSSSPDVTPSPFERASIVPNT